MYHGGLFTEGAEANGNPIRAPYEGNAADQRAVNKEVLVPAVGTTFQNVPADGPQIYIREGPAGPFVL